MGSSSVGDVLARLSVALGCSGTRRDALREALRKLERHRGAVPEDAGEQRKGYAVAGQQSHYFSDQPTTPSERRLVRVELADVALDLTTDTGVFAARQLDPGTKILLEAAPQPADDGGALLDLGCGYGPIALTLARRCPASTVWATDVNERALELTSANSTGAGLSGVRVAKPADVPEDVRFTAIYSNPPIRAGKAVLHEMLRQWLPRLAPEGLAYLVVARNLGSDSLVKWLVGEGFPARRLRSKSGYRILEVASPEAGE